MKANKFELELQQIKQIRSLRVETLRRKQRALSMLESNAATKIQECNLSFQSTETRLIQEQSDSLSRLKTNGPVKAHRLVEYTKLQLRSGKEIKDAMKEIEYSHTSYQEAKDNTMQGVQALQKAEKRLFRLQEVISERLWK